MRGCRPLRGVRIEPALRWAGHRVYLGADRADRFLNGPIVPGTHRYRAPKRFAYDSLAYEGSWRIGHDDATSVQRSRLHLVFGARRVFLVLGSRGGTPRGVRVTLDGKPIAAEFAGRDVKGSVVEVGRQRLYRLVELPRAERHLLTLDFAPGVSGYAFTFG